MYINHKYISHLNSQMQDMLELKSLIMALDSRVDVLGRAFDPYMTTKPKGNGLGLAIVKKIIEEHNGVIRATNQKQGGAAINIRFPLYEYGLKNGKENLRVEN